MNSDRRNEPDKVMRLVDQVEKAAMVGVGNDFLALLFAQLRQALIAEKLAH